MEEQFLHYIWKYQKFNKEGLMSTDGQSVKVFHPGNHNHHSGPDFEESKIKVGAIEWVGQVEIHVNSSDWMHHKHQDDPAYENVILHVVWNHNREIRISNEPIHTLELKNLVDPDLVQHYQRYFKSKTEILCSNRLTKVSSPIKQSMLDRVLVERLESKALELTLKMKRNRNDWEEATYCLLLQNFGFSTNKEAFIRLSELLPFAMLKKVLQSHMLTEALLFGQAGFLENPVDTYSKELKREFDYLSNKFQLPEPMPPSQWKYSKLRPANFPTVRISQLATILHHHPQLFTLLTQSKRLKKILGAFQSELSEYWQAHYDFGQKRKRRIKCIGLSSAENLLINTAVPMLAAYSKHVSEQSYMNRALNFLNAVPAEHNYITKKWQRLGLRVKTSFDSQACIQLFKTHCKNRKCLTCNIGVAILNK